MASRLPYPIDHASHLPILIGLGALLPIKSVFEFGAGEYSTLTLLNKKVFPDVEKVVSLESDPTWICKIRIDAGLDERLEFIHSSEHYAPGDYDLVFIDNGPEQHKIETIHNMSEDLGANGLYVIHDAEHGPYADEVKRFKDNYFFYMFNPSTAVASTKDFTEKQRWALSTISSVIRSNTHIPVDDVKSWSEGFKWVKFQS
jgi:predicted O-methyltransferase YrrM